MITIKGFVLFNQDDPNNVEGGLILTDQHCEITLKSVKPFTDALKAHAWLQGKATSMTKTLEGFQLERKTELQG